MSEKAVQILRKIRDANFEIIRSMTFEQRSDFIQKLADRARKRLKSNPDEVAKETN